METSNNSQPELNKETTSSNGSQATAPTISPSSQLEKRGLGWMWIIILLLGTPLVVFVLFLGYNQYRIYEARQAAREVYEEANRRQQSLYYDMNEPENNAPALGVPAQGDPSATLDASSLTTTSRTPIITGTAKNVSSVFVEVDNVNYAPNVIDGKWSTYSPVTLSPGSYPVIVKTDVPLSEQKILTAGTLIVK